MRMPVGLQSALRAGADHPTGGITADSEQKGNRAFRDLRRAQRHHESVKSRDEKFTEAGLNFLHQVA
jgi:hypothetical protein